jgi:hypothetical protein
MICQQMLQTVYYTYMSGVKYCDYGVILEQKARCEHIFMPFTALI